MTGRCNKPRVAIKRAVSLLHDEAVKLRILLSLLIINHRLPPSGEQKTDQTDQTMVKMWSTCSPNGLPPSGQQKTDQTDQTMVKCGLHVVLVDRTYRLPPSGQQKTDQRDQTMVKCGLQCTCSPQWSAAVRGAEDGPNRSNNGKMWSTCSPNGLSPSGEQKTDQTDQTTVKRGLHAVPMDRTNRLPPSVEQKTA